MNDTQTIVFYESELRKRKEDLRETIKMVELTRLSLWEQYLEVKAWEMGMAQPYAHLPISIIESYEMTKDYLCFVLEGNLPVIYDKVDAKYYRKVRGHHIEQIVQFSAKHGENVRFEPAFVFLAHYFPDQRISDLDNRNKSFIFNGLRYSGLIPDDNWMNLAYMEQGFLDKKHPRTEIWVGELKNAIPIIQQVLGKNMVK